MVQIQIQGNSNKIEDNADTDSRWCRYRFKMVQIHIQDGSDTDSMVQIQIQDGADTDSR